MESEKRSLGQNSLKRVQNNLSHLLGPVNEMDAPPPKIDDEDHCFQQSHEAAALEKIGVVCDKDDKRDPMCKESLKRTFNNDTLPGHKVGQPLPFPYKLH